MDKLSLNICLYNSSCLWRQPVAAQNTLQHQAAHECGKKQSRTSTVEVKRVSDSSTSSVASDSGLAKTVEGASLKARFAGRQSMIIRRSAPVAAEGFLFTKKTQNRELWAAATKREDLVSQGPLKHLYTSADHPPAQDPCRV